MEEVYQFSDLYARYRALPHVEDALRNCNMILEAEVDVLLNVVCGENEVERGRRNDARAWSAGIRITMNDLEETDNIQRRIMIALHRCPRTEAFIRLIEGAGMDLFACLDVLEE